MAEHTPDVQSDERGDMPESDGEQLARLGTDANAWAEEWLRLNPMGLLAANEDDLDTMRTWFACAIEAGRSKGWGEGVKAAEVDGVGF